MEKANQEKSKKITIVVGLVAAGVFAVTGIFLCFHKEKSFDYIAEESEMSSQTIEVDTENEIIYPDTEAEKELLIDNEAETEVEKELVIDNEAETEVEKELVIDNEAETEVEKELVIDNEVASDLENMEHIQNEIVQPLQKEPEKTENKKPAKPPVEVTNTDIGNVDVQPENKEIPAQTESQTSASTGGTSETQHGTVKDGKIYIDGFGWIDYNGGETDVIEGDDIYENGNTVGIMD